MCVCKSGRLVDLIKRLGRLTTLKVFVHRLMLPGHSRSIPVQLYIAICHSPAIAVTAIVTRLDKFYAL